MDKDTGAPSEFERKSPELTAFTIALSEWHGVTTSPPSPDGKPFTGLRLNPSFVGWMMGTPSCGECGREWTDPDCPHSVTAFMSTADGSSASRSGSTCERDGGNLDPF
jgi:hypothetical protein